MPITLDVEQNTALFAIARDFELGSYALNCHGWFLFVHDIDIILRLWNAITTSRHLPNGTDKHICSGDINDFHVDAFANRNITFEF